MRVFLCHNNVSSVHVWMVANSYLLVFHYSVPQTMTEDSGKCVVTFICSMGILYVANSMQYLSLQVILFMLNNTCMTHNGILWISTLKFLCSCYV
jgi:hypothetical protein